MLPPLDPESVCLLLLPLLPLPPRIHEVLRTRGGFSVATLVTVGSRSRFCTDVRVLSLELLVPTAAEQLTLGVGITLAPGDAAGMTDSFAICADMDEEFEDPDSSCTSYNDSCELARFTCTILDEETLAGASKVTLSASPPETTGTDTLGISVLSSSSTRDVELTLLLDSDDPPPPDTLNCWSVLDMAPEHPLKVPLTGGGEFTIRSKLSSVELMEVLMLKLALSIESMLLLLIEEQQLSSSITPPDIKRFTSRSGLSILVEESTESCSVLLLLLALCC